MSRGALSTFLLVFLLLNADFCSGTPEAKADAAFPSSLRHMVGFQIKARKLLAMDALQDYDEVCANPRHDPRRRPGCKNL